jgi:hypothetical protein
MSTLTLNEALELTEGDLREAMDLILESLNTSITSTQESLDSLSLLQTAVDNEDQETINTLTESIIASNESVLQNSSNVLDATTNIVESAETLGGDVSTLNDVLTSTQETFERASLSLENYTSSLLQIAIDAISDESLTKEQIMDIHNTAVISSKANNTTEYLDYLNSINLLKAQQVQQRIENEENSPSYRVFSIPITLDARADTTVFGEQLLSVSYDYYFSDVSALYLSADHFNNALKYRDQNSGSALFQVDDGNMILLSTAIEFELALNTFQLDPIYGPTKYVDASNSPTDDSFGNHYLQYLASLLFKHPQAQAPIKNDEYIKYQIEVLSGIATQIYNQFKDDVDETTSISQGIVKSLYEQLLLDKGRVPAFDSMNYKMFDFRPGDIVEFTVNASSNVIYETETYPGVIQTVNPDDIFHYLNSSDYENGGLVKSKIWRFGFRLK